MWVLPMELIWVRMGKYISQKISAITATGRYGIPSALNFLCWCWPNLRECGIWQPLWFICMQRERKTGPPDSNPPRQCAPNMLWFSCWMPTGKELQPLISAKAMQVWRRKWNGCPCVRPIRRWNRLMIYGPWLRSPESSVKRQILNNTDNARSLSSRKPGRRNLWMSLLLLKWWRITDSIREPAGNTDGQLRNTSIKW